MFLTTRAHACTACRSASRCRSRRVCRGPSSPPGPARSGRRPRPVRQRGPFPPNRHGPLHPTRHATATMAPKGGPTIAADYPPDETTGGPPLNSKKPKASYHSFRISGEVVGPRPPGGGPGGVARGRVVLPGRVRGDRPEAEPETGDQVLRSRRSWGGSVGCERGRAPGDHSPRVDESGVEPRRVGMVCRKVRVTGRGTSRRGPLGRSDGHPACRPLRSRRFSLDTGMRRVSNASSGESGKVPDNEVNTHLRNPV